MRILLTNDDGILAPGLAGLYEGVADLGDVDVVAPAGQQTGVGHGITVDRPMAVQRVRVPNAFEGWSVDGRPADCVKLALLKLLDHRPDFVLSGINAGLNTGPYLRYSGTVAAAVEAAAFFAVPALAFSLELSETPDFSRAGRLARRIFERFVAANPPPGAGLNINIPALDGGEPKGIRVCPHATAVGSTQYHEEIHADGRRSFRFAGGDPGKMNHPNTDTRAVFDGCVAITPLTFDLTDHARLADVAGWDWPARFD